MDKIGAAVGLLLASWILSMTQSDEGSLTRKGYQALVLLVAISRDPGSVGNLSDAFLMLLAQTVGILDN